jgi:hypothetical protein
MLSEPPGNLDVVLNGGLGVVAPLEFLQHRPAEVGQRNLLVTHKVPDQSSVAHALVNPRWRFWPPAVRVMLPASQDRPR